MKWLNNLFKSLRNTGKAKGRKLSLAEIAAVYDLVKPYLNESDTFDQLIRAMFNDDYDRINKLYELLTGKKSDDVEGLEIVSTVLDCLRTNDIGSFVALMKGRK